MEFADRMLRLKVVARTTNEYHQFLNNLKLYRMVVDKAICLIHTAYTLASDLKKAVPAKNQQAYDTFIAERADRDVVLQFARFMVGPEAMSSANFTGELIPVLRQQLEHVYPKLVGEISDVFGRDIIVAAIEEAHKVYKQKDAVLKVSRDKLIYNHDRPLPNVCNIGMQVLRYYDPNDAKFTDKKNMAISKKTEKLISRYYGDKRVCCGVVEEDGEFKIWLALDATKAAKEKRLWFVAHGNFENNGEIQTKKLKSFCDRNWLHKMAKDKVRYCDMVFNARDGKITINIPYKVPVMEAKVDTARQLHVGFYHEEGKPKGKDGKDLSDVGKDFFIHVQVPLGGGVDKYRHFKIPVNNVVEHLKQLAIARSRAELRKNCCMTRGLKTGIQKQREQFRTDANTVSRARDLFVQDNNHLWSKSIVEFAQRWHCGTIKVYLSKDLQFLYGTWPFSQLTDFIEYKGKKCGVNVEKITSEGTEKFLEFFKDKEEEE